MTSVGVYIFEQNAGDGSIQKGEVCPVAAADFGATMFLLSAKEKNIRDSPTCRCVHWQ